MYVKSPKRKSKETFYQKVSDDLYTLLNEFQIFQKLSKLQKIQYSRVPNKRVGWNKHVGRRKMEKLINV